MLIDTVHIHDMYMSLIPGSTHVNCLQWMEAYLVSITLFSEQNEQLLPKRECRKRKPYNELDDEEEEERYEQLEEEPLPGPPPHHEQVPRPQKSKKRKYSRNSIGSGVKGHSTQPLSPGIPPSPESDTAYSAK